MTRRWVGLLGLAAMGAAALVGGHPGPAAAVPVATDEATYDVMGRVFPDPHGCRRGLPASSPWAKGNVCAVEYLQSDEALDGVRYLNRRFPRFIELVNLHDLKASVPEFAELDMQSAGIPRADGTRDRRDLYVVKVTDRESPIADAARQRFVFSLSIHGIERAGVEGGLRAAEDLVTWAATAPDTRILEPTGTGPAAGEVLRHAVLYFILPNPDGWVRGELTDGGATFQRYNGNGVDLNRDLPTIGYTEPLYTPGSEPETRAMTSYLLRERRLAGGAPFAAGIDLHGMLDAPSFSFTLLGASQRDFRKNELTVRTAVTMFRDSQRRLGWSPLILPPEDCPGPIALPASLNPVPGRLPMCADQWGTVWDTINYSSTGSMSDWIDSAAGLDGVGISNEMAYSHLAPNTVFVPEIEQLHIDGNKALIYSQITSLLSAEPVQFVPRGRIAFVPNPHRLRRASAAAPAAPSLPSQAGIDVRDDGGGFEFDVRGPNDGIHNGSVTVEATYTNVQGTSLEDVELFLDRFGPTHAGDPEGWQEVAHYYNQQQLYFHAGARLDLDDPLPGRYRVRPGRHLPVDLHITFSPSASTTLGEQRGYDVANTDALVDLNRYVAADRRLRPVDPATILGSPAALAGTDTLLLADDPAPGVAEPHRSAWFARLRAFVEGGGNLVLTDAAVGALTALGVVPADAVHQGFYYAGWMDFDDGGGATYRRHPLAAGVDKEGTAEGQDEVEGLEFSHRHQTYESVPLGFYVSANIANRLCQLEGDRCDSRNWIVDERAWREAGGSVAARTFVRTGEAGGSDGTVGVSLGELHAGKGVIRILGSLLPSPTEKNPHPTGLAAYALTYTGYQILENALDHVRLPAAAIEGPLPATGGLTEPAMSVAVLALLLALAARRFVGPADLYERHADLGEAVTE